MPVILHMKCIISWIMEHHTTMREMIRLQLQEAAEIKATRYSGTAYPSSIFAYWLRFGRNAIIVIAATTKTDPATPATIASIELEDTPVCEFGKKKEYSVLGGLSSKQQLMPCASSCCRCLPFLPIPIPPSSKLYITSGQSKSITSGEAVPRS
eukprot:m.379106 g.379106  ORF g.379106 m.379106 type:complete len:153 (-) comp20945_c0_seq1:1296-1754(-)